MSDNDNHLRNVTMRPYRDQSISFTLNTWDTGRTDHLGKSIIRYEFSDRKGCIFKGSDFACSPMHAIDSDECVRALLSFLTLRPGDTDSEYFDNYTPEQLDFANEHGETLQMYTLDDEPRKFESSD